MWERNPKWMKTHAIRLVMKTQFTCKVPVCDSIGPQIKAGKETTEPVLDVRGKPSNKENSSNRIGTENRHTCKVPVYDSNQGLQSNKSRERNH